MFLSFEATCPGAFDTGVPTRPNTCRCLQATVLRLLREPGTSTGGLLSVAVGLRKMSLDDCNFIYKVLGQKVFSRVVSKQDGKEEGWMEVRPRPASCTPSWHHSLP